MSITDKQDDTVEGKSVPSKEVTSKTSEEITTKPQAVSPSGQSTDGEESPSTEITEKSPKALTPEERSANSRSYYEKLLEEKEAKQKPSKYQRMEEIRQEIAENPEAINAYENSADAVLVNEMLAANDVTLNDAFNKHYKKGQQATVDVESLIEKKLAAERLKNERIGAFNKVNELYPGFKGSKIEKEIIDFIGKKAINEMSPESLYETLRLHASTKMEKKADLVTEAQKNIHNQVVPGSSGKPSSVSLTKEERLMYEKRLNREMTPERWKYLKYER